MSRIPKKGCCGGRAPPTETSQMPQPLVAPKSAATCCAAKNTESQGGLDLAPRIEPEKKKSCKMCCAKSGAHQRSGRAEQSAYTQRLEPRPPLTYRSMQHSQDDYERDISIPRVQFGGESPGQCSGGQDQFRRPLSPLLTPPLLGSRGQPCSPSPLPFDFSLGLSHHESSLESLVEEQLKLNASRSPCSPARAKGSRVKIVSPPVIMTNKGPIPGSHQVSIERTVNRFPGMEVISRRMTGTTAEDCQTASQIELNVQNMEFGGLNAAGRGDLMHDAVSVTNTLTIGPGTRAKTSKTVYEYTPKPSAESGLGMDPAQVLEMIEEESKEIDKMKYLQPPELKGLSIEDYGLKKKLQKMKLNRESVRRLESSVINPPPDADEPQEELQPELMAAIMHTEERGLTMDSAPANVYNYLFPEVKDDIVIKISSVAPSPLQNIVVPVEVPSTLHTSSVTREMQFVAANTRCSQGALPVDNIYAKSVLKPGVAPKVNNTAMQDKKIRKTKENYPILVSEEPPWGIEDLQPLITLVGASPSHTVPAQDISDLQSPSIYHNELENSLEYQLIPEAPRHVSRVQLRGTQKPPWFPGYFIALPDSIKLARSPSEVLPAAWQAVQPDIFADDSFLVVG